MGEVEEVDMWITRWNAIAARIDGLSATSSLFLRSIAAGESDYYGVANGLIIPEAKEIRKLVEDFRRDFADILPPGAVTALDIFLCRSSDVFHGTSGGIPGVAGSAVALVSIRATLAFHLFGAESVARSVTERAFEHLQRSIVADETCQSKWLSAFQTGETACERLGATHLLLHGIWGFKINAKGEKTDLVFGEPLTLGHAERTAPVAIVLTEWKLARSRSELAGQYEIAKRQAKLYSEGALSDLEVSSLRFLIVVTDSRSEAPPDLVEGNICYRHKVIAVRPESPSVAARSS